ncbi:MAG TPA: HipA domain-containing protein [Niastella sp.]
MSLPEIKYCPSTLQPGFTTYSPAAQQALFGSRSKKVSHILPFGSPGKSSELTREFNERKKQISISGVQEKYSLRLQKNSLLLTEAGGTHILKPVPAQRLDRVTDLPANEHVSMQIARQVFGIKTAACGMIFFDNGSPAYITRRFDYKPDGTGKYQVEDFATLLAKTPETEGDGFKYNGSYLNIAKQIQRHVAATPVALLEFFRLVVFNFLIANGDAHLKNFSLMETEQGDFMLSPAYDLLCTALHIDDTPLALRDGLYEGDYNEKAYLNFGTYTGTSFVVFAEMVGINPALARNVVNELMQGTFKAMELVERSFLSDDAKKKYINILGDRYRSLGLK